MGLSPPPPTPPGAGPPQSRSARIAAAARALAVLGLSAAAISVLVVGVRGCQHVYDGFVGGLSEAELDEYVASVLPEGARPAEIEYGVCLAFHDLTCAHAKVRQLSDEPPEVRVRAYLDVAVANGWRLRRMEWVGSSLSVGLERGDVTAHLRIVRDDGSCGPASLACADSVSVEKHYTA